MLSFNWIKILQILIKNLKNRAQLDIFKNC